MIHPSRDAINRVSIENWPPPHKPRRFFVETRFIASLQKTETGTRKLLSTGDTAPLYLDAINRVSTKYLRAPVNFFLPGMLRSRI